MPEEATDTELMRRLAAGEDAALNELMQRWRDRVGAFLFRMTNEGAIAVELTQETFVRLYRSRLRYRAKASFSSYLFTIAANLARDHARWRARHPLVELEEKHLSVLADANPSPAERMESQEELAAVNAAVQALPAELREALMLLVYEDLGYREIAGIAGCSPKAVETRIYRARQALKEALVSDS